MGQERRRNRTDNLNPEQRRRAMKAVRSHGTSIERQVDAILSGWGVPYEAGTATKLPGRPDFVLPQLRAVIFVHGCFWHRHGCRSITPQTNQAYWEAKLDRNRRRDRRVRRELNRMGWSVLVIWGCQLKSEEAARLAVLRALRRATDSRAVGMRGQEGRE